MDLKDILAISGAPGLFKLISNRESGLVVEDLQTGKSRFYSVRKYQFTPLESISIYTYEDSAELPSVFSELHKSESIPSTSGTHEELRSFFKKILPDYDEDKVKISDIKKVIKWYHVLQSTGYFDRDESVE